MTDIDSIEQRLRRTFQVVAEQPIGPLGDAEPWRNAPGPPSRPRRQLVVGGLAVLVVIALVVFGITYGPRSSRPTPRTQPGLGGPTSGLRAVFAPAKATSRAVLEEAATTMTNRLHALGDNDATVSVVHGTIVVSGPTLSRSQVQLVGSAGAFSIRPVLCGAPAYTAPTPPAAPGTTTPATPLPACEAQYATTASNIDVNTNTGVPANTIGPDPIFASSPSTAAEDDASASSVLLPADPAAGVQQYPRFVLGAAQFNSSGIAKVEAQYEQSISGWLVNITLTAPGATEWNAIALLSFHAFIAIDLDGDVLSAPLIEPNASSFNSFGAQIQIAANFTPTEAKNIAAVLGSGPLPVRFSLQSLTPGN
jgi:preprotein translocase subunit SecD